MRGELGTVANTVRPARAEFGWIYLQSLIETAERRVDDHRARRRRLRAWWAARRLQELRAYEEWRNLPAGGELASPPRTAFALASAALVCAAAGAFALALHSADGSAPAAADLAFLTLASIWFVLGVACAGDRS
jgi:hypothetical protein